MIRIESGAYRRDDHFCMGRQLLRGSFMWGVGVVVRRLVSVVVPIYNVECYLPRCLDSIVGQTYENLEILLVDDGSTDSSPAICDAYARQDARIKVIHKENGGLSDARNAAIDVAKGKYFFMLDSDDFIELDTISFLVKSLERGTAGIATCSFRNHYDTSIHAGVLSDNNHEKVCDAHEALKKLLYQDGVTTSAWGKLYKRELFDDGTRYPFGKICEDLPVTYSLFAKSKKIVINSTVKVHYQQRADSIIRTNFKPARMDALGFAKDQLDFIKKEYPDLENAAVNRYFMEAVYVYGMIPVFAKEFREDRHATWTVMRQYRQTIIHDKDNTLRYAAQAAYMSYFGRIVLAVYLRARKVLGTALKRL